MPAENPTARFLRNVGQQLIMPLLGIFTALLLGALIILISGFDPISAYVGLWNGAFGNLERLNGTLEATTPYIFTTLAVIFSFRAGLFNIGAEGQLKIGAITAAWVGINVAGLSPFIGIPLTILAGMLAGALWGALPGALKAFSGAHEVITTIMLNYIASYITGYLVGAQGPLRGTQLTTTNQISNDARIATIIGFDAQTASGSTNTPLHYGFFIAILAIAIIFWILWKTPFGFEIRTVGLNPSAARYAGISVSRTIIIVMAVSGLLAGLAGTLEVMANPSVGYRFSQSLGAGYGFNSIAIALLAKNSPLAAFPAALLFAALQSGAGKMQFDAVSLAGDGRQLPGDLINIVQALVIIFVAADQVLRWMYRIKVGKSEQIVLSRGWGKAE